MVKMIVGLLAGMIVTGILFMGPLSPTPITAQTEDASLTETPVDIVETYRETIISVLQAAGDEIQDNDTAQFYQKLLQEYALDEPSPEKTPAEQFSLTELLPDIKNINQKALTLPLQEAGKNIRDKEIAQFYYKLLKDAGWTIESN